MLGNPLIKEEMELQSEIKDLKMEKSRYSENIFDLQDKIRVKIPAAIQQTEAHIESFRNDFPWQTISKRSLPRTASQSTR